MDNFLSILHLTEQLGSVEWTLSEEDRWMDKVCRGIHSGKRFSELAPHCPPEHLEACRGIYFQHKGERAIKYGFYNVAAALFSHVDLQMKTLVCHCVMKDAGKIREFMDKNRERHPPYRDVYLAIWAAETQENYYQEALEILDASRLYDGGLIKMCIARYMRLNGNLSSAEPCALGRVARLHAYGVLASIEAALNTGDLPFVDETYARRLLR